MTVLLTNIYINKIRTLFALKATTVFHVMPRYDIETPLVTHTLGRAFHPLSGTVGVDTSSNCCSRVTIVFSAIGFVGITAISCAMVFDEKIRSMVTEQLPYISRDVLAIIATVVCVMCICACMCVFVFRKKTPTTLKQLPSINDV
jgi:hypothetical protein